MNDVAGNPVPLDNKSSFKLGLENECLVIQSKLFKTRSNLSREPFEKQFPLEFLKGSEWQIVEVAIAFVSWGLLEILISILVDAKGQAEF